MKSTASFKTALFISLMAFFLAACSTNEHVIQPAKLVDFDKQLKLKKLWSVSVGDGVDDAYLSLKPVISGQMIYVANADGAIISLDREKGKKNWKVNTKRRITGGLAAAYGQVFFGTINGKLVALDAKDGSEQWEAQLSSEILAVPDSNAEFVIAQTIDGQLFGLDRTTGGQLWQFDTVEPILTLRGSSSPKIEQTVAIAGFANGKLAAVDLQKGEPIWEKQVGISKGRSELERLIDLDGGFIVSGRTIFASTYQGRVSAVDLYTGRALWQRDVSSYVGVEEESGNLFIADSSGYLWSLDAETGATQWQQKALEARTLSAPAAINDYIVVGDYEGYLHWMKKGDGEFVARIRVDAQGLRTKPLVREGVVYVYGNGGRLSALTIKAPKDKG